MAAPEALDTPRLRLRRPTPADAEAIFTRYGSDPAVTEYLGWRCHTSVADTQTFLTISAEEWARWGVGAYVVVSRAGGRLLGGTGLSCDTETQASTGYVLARDAWGQGFASEALGAMVRLAADVGLRHLYALCHKEHRASAHVLEKASFELEAVLPRFLVFPNRPSGVPEDVLRYGRAPA